MAKNHQPKPERGAASLRIELSKSRITVRHGQSEQTILLQRTVTDGFWKRLWATLQHD